MDRRVGVICVPSPSDERLDELTEREREILGLLARGLTDHAIGEHLWLSKKTVETHVRHILAKLGLPGGGRHNRRVLAAVTYRRVTRGVRAEA